MLNLLTKLMAIYKTSLTSKRLARRQLIQSQLAEAEALEPQVQDLLSAVEQEQAELQTYLGIVTADEKGSSN